MEKAGKEIIQLSVKDLTGACKRPDKELKGFEKVFLNPGETKTVTMTLNKRSFAWYSEDMQDWYAATGEYEILVGASSRDIRLKKKTSSCTKRRIPLTLDLNTTLSELLAEDETRTYGMELKKKLDAVAGLMPIRNIVSFGLCKKEEGRLVKNPTT